MGLESAITTANFPLSPSKYLQTADFWLPLKCEQATLFTIVDMNKGYWQVELHSESKTMTCILVNSHGKDLCMFFSHL